MKQEISKGAMAGVIGAVVVVIAAIGFFLLRDQGPEKHPSMNPRDKIPAAPPTSEPPAWFVDKLRENNAKAATP